MIRILSTKKLDYTWNKPVICDEISFISITEYPYAISNLHQAAIFTSSNAVKIVVDNNDLSKNNKTYCVGSKTRELLINLGFKVQAHYKCFSDLADAMISSEESSFNLFVGNRYQKKEVERLSAHKRVDVIQCYKNEASSHAVQGTYDALLFFSPSGIDSYLIKNKITTEECFCIGETTAEHLSPFTDRIHVGEEWTVNGLCGAVEKYYYEE